MSNLASCAFLHLKAAYQVACPSKCTVITLIACLIFLFKLPADVKPPIKAFEDKNFKMQGAVQHKGLFVCCPTRKSLYTEKKTPKTSCNFVRCKVRRVFLANSAVLCGLFCTKYGASDVCLDLHLKWGSEIQSLAGMRVKLLLPPLYLI